tara:strand:- start:455 stop:3010 length:2556 start_codon:yes stop_codon:yes gene_type:complete
MKKRGIFFSLDALIALSIVILILIIAIPYSNQLKISTDIHYDLISTLSTLKVGEINNSYVQSLISSNVITNLNNSILEQIAELSVTNITIAKALADSVFEELDSNQNIGIWFGSDLIASKNSTSFQEANNIETARQTLSGIQQGDSVTGFSARAFLSSSSQRKYFYFGGYLGDGNITIPVEYYGNITSAEIELTTNSDFDLSVNGVPQGSFTKSSDEFTPVNYSIPITDFNSGNNTLLFTGSGLHIAGGFIKITYQAETLYQQPKKYLFPGISGLINIYDSFYVPGSLKSLSISLHLDTNFTTFLSIGNTTVFNSTSNGEETITITNSTLAALLDYQDLSQKTIPIRIGLENASYSLLQNTSSDIFSVTDLSGSMTSCGLYEEPYTCHYSCWPGGSQSCSVNDPEDCQSNVCSGNCWFTWGHYLDCQATKLELAKQANNVFIDALLNYSLNSVGLAGYQSTASDTDFHNLSKNSVSLKAKVDDWNAAGSTCICCGINKAASALATNSTPGSLRAIVVMSDGEANVQCSQQNTGSSKQDAIQAACDALTDHNITVHAIAFGSTADETTMQQIAQCGDGDYYFGDVEEIVEIYSQIANNLIAATFQEQVITALGNFHTQLFSDSYIEFDYDSTPTPVGLLISLEEQFSNSTFGSFTIPQNSSIIEAAITSYSGPRWTESAYLNSIQIYNLRNYGPKFIEIGDPYIVNIPKDNISQSNSVTLLTASSYNNITVGSPYNKIIYRVVKNVSSFSEILSKNEGCTWTIEFDDSSNATVSIPSDYSGSNLCLYTQASISHDVNDAIQVAAYNILKELDFDSDGDIDTKFTEQDLQISTSQISGIPYTWSTEVQSRIWS